MVVTDEPTLCAPRSRRPEIKRGLRCETVGYLPRYWPQLLRLRLWWRARTRAQIKIIPVTIPPLRNAGSILPGVNMRAAPADGTTALPPTSPIRVSPPQTAGAMAALLRTALALPASSNLYLCPVSRPRASFTCRRSGPRHRPRPERSIWFHRKAGNRFNAPRKCVTDSRILRH